MSEIYSFPVELQDLYTADGKVSKRKAVVRTDTNKILSDVSSSYKIVHHNEIFKLAEDYITQIGKPTIKYHTVNDGAKIVGEYTFKEVHQDVKVGDTVGLRLYFSNSYDGKSSVNLTVGGLRLKCLNGMVGSTNDFSVKHRHTGENIQDGKLLNIELPVPEQVVSSFRTNFQYWNKLTQIELKSGDLDFYQQKAIEDGAITPAIIKANIDLEEPTAWGLYNMFTEYITHKEKASAAASGKIMRFNKVENWFRGVFA